MLSICCTTESCLCLFQDGRVFEFVTPYFVPHFVSKYCVIIPSDKVLILAYLFRQTVWLLKTALCVKFIQVLLKVVCSGRSYPKVLLALWIVSLFVDLALIIQAAEVVSVLLCESVYFSR